jgi:hypothetical protein
MSQKRQKKETKQIRIDLELHRKLRHLAVESDTKLADLATLLITEALAGRGAKVAKLLGK